MHTHLFIQPFEHCKNCHCGSVGLKGCLHVLYSNGKHESITVRLKRAG